MMTEINTTICPICQQPNHCQSGTGHCWCCRIEPVPQGLIDQLPPQYQGTACICAKCIDQYRQQQ